MGQQFAYFPLGGGLDLITPAIAQKPGSAIGALNYEPAANGYRRVEGYERFDGRLSPTDAPYYELDFTPAPPPFVLGDTITGATSGATGKVLATGVAERHLWQADAAGYVGLGAITGTFSTARTSRSAGSPAPRQRQPAALHRARRRDFARMAAAGHRQCPRPDPGGSRRRLDPRGLGL
jgi:hypothetical protein